MAKVKLPCMSAEAHGSVIPGIVFATNRHGQYVKFLPEVKQPRTAGQIAVRHAYGQIATEWRMMTPEERQAYHSEAVRNRRTDYNEYFHQRWPEVYNP